MMLHLDSEKWKELQHAYGSAENIPDLLRQLPAAPGKTANYQDEPWFSLWSALCHQNDVYSASYTAVPHIVENAALKPSQERWNFVLLTSSIELCRHREGAPTLTSEFETDYFVAIEKMRVLTLECLANKLSEEDTQLFLGALAIFKGFPKLGETIFEMLESQT